MLNGMTADFNDFFSSIHGCEPYSWQTRLADFVLGEERLPSAIDMPTGTGKSAVIDIGVFALAMKPDVFPRRIAFVVDRRVVVDQACARAEKIRRAIDAAGSPVLKEVRDRLKRLSGSGEILEVASLRGGAVLIDDGWTRYPDQPGIIVCTVDMFGSRLLFRGYGVSSRMRPVHAALTGSDCLAALDEVQISRAFEGTLKEIQRRRQRERLPNRFMSTRMSATTGDERADEAVFRLTPADMRDARLRPIVEKRAALRLEAAKTRDAMRKKAVGIVKALAKDRRFARVGVIVNRVNSAREIGDDLRGLADVDASVLTGRMRPIDRIESAERLISEFDPETDAPPLGKNEPIRVLVSTQSVEVGVDISFDALISECAPSDSLRQRFGRLARRGRNPEPAPFWIIGVGSGKSEDPIYGRAAANTWNELRRLVKKERVVDQSFFADELSQEDTRAPFYESPLILDSHMDVWAQTNPSPAAQPNLEWHLHGIRRDADDNPEVAIVWRDDVSRSDMNIAPPEALEELRIPLVAAREWLRRGEGESEVADVYAPAPERESRASLDSPKRGWRNGLWVRRAASRSFAEMPAGYAISPGDVIIVPAERGGLSRDGVWDPGAKLTVDDLGDAARMERGGSVTLRLNRKAAWRNMKKGISPPPLPNDGEESDSREEWEKVKRWLAEWRKAEFDADFAVGCRDPETSVKMQTRIVDYLLDPSREVELVSAEDGDGRRFYAVVSIERGASIERDMDGSDESGSMTGAATLLRDHMEGVGRRAGDTAERLGMPPSVADDLRLAGRLHDVGKADERCQLALVGGSPISAALLDAPLAKSAPRAERVPLPTRHDMVGAAMAAASPEVLAQASDPDLVIHLIASHHGLARPLGRFARDESPRTVRYEFDGHTLEANSDVVNEPEFDIETVARFRRLTRKYGHHGLAWLETILRLADHRQSAEESRKHDAGKQ